MLNMNHFNPSNKDSSISSKKRNTRGRRKRARKVQKRKVNGQKKVKKKYFHGF